jgi:phosphoserine phosphatase RsbU/P
MLKIAIGHSEDVDTRIAVQSAINQCKGQLGRLAPQAGVVFAGIEYQHQEILLEILGHFPGIELIGCTSAGELSSVSGCSDDSVGLMLFYSDAIEIRSGLGRQVSKDPAAAVRAAVVQANSRQSAEAALCLVFPDSYSGYSYEIINCLNAELGVHCPIFGGAAGTLDFERSPLQFFGTAVVQDAVPLLLFYGDIALEFDVGNSWQPLGMRAKVTEASGKSIKRIGDMKALDFYRYYVGPHGHPVAEFPLAVYEDGATQFYIRTATGYDEKTGSISFPGPIPQGATVQLTEATRKQIFEHTQASINRVSNKLSQAWQPSAAIVFSCVTRKGILGTRTPEELQILKRFLPDRIPIFGFYSFGEFSPLEKNQRSRLHSSSIVTLLLGEAGSQRAADNIADLQATPPPSIPEAADETDRLKREAMFLRRKFKRSEFYRQRLESTIEMNAALLKKINQDVNTARLEIQRKNELLRQALALADEIQKNMLPRENLDLEKFRIAGKSVYCSETGGDYYDFIKTSEDLRQPLNIVVGDVTGHGIEAALLMTTARALIRSRASQPGSISQILTDVNKHLAYDINASGRFMTMFYLTIDPQRKCLNWVRAGHDPAILYDPSTDTFESLAGPGMALGVDEFYRYQANEKYGLKKDQVIFLGTDGIWETHNPKGGMLGKQSVLEIIRQNASGSPAAIIDTIINAMNDFRENLEPEDDATLVAIKIDEEL